MKQLTIDGSPGEQYVRISYKNTYASTKCVEDLKKAVDTLALLNALIYNIELFRPTQEQMEKKEKHESLVIELKVEELEVIINGKYKQSRVKKVLKSSIIGYSVYVIQRLGCTKENLEELVLAKFEKNISGNLGSFIKHYNKA